MRKFIDTYHRLLCALLVIAVAVLIIPVSLQIFSRFTHLIPSYIWTEEMARFFFIWMIMIGSMVGIRDSAHFDVDLWPELKPRANALLRLISHVFVLAMALVAALGNMSVDRIDQRGERIDQLRQPFELLPEFRHLAG